MTTKEEVLRLAEEASNMVVDWDLRGTPITEAHVVMMGAYGPFMMRFYELAKQAGAADQAREHQKAIEAIREADREILSALECGFRAAAVNAIKGNGYDYDRQRIDAAIKLLEARMK